MNEIINNFEYLSRRAAKHNQYDFICYFMQNSNIQYHPNKDSFDTISKFEFYCKYRQIYMKHNKPLTEHTASKIYFWWIPKCYDMSKPAGIRMANANLAEFETFIGCSKSYVKVGF